MVSVRHDMDATPLFDPQYLPVILGTLIGFALLAAALLVPVSRFLDREQEVAEDWTPEAVAKRMSERRETKANGEEASEASSSDNGSDGASTPS